MIWYKLNIDGFGRKNTMALGGVGFMLRDNNSFPLCACCRFIYWRLVIWGFGCESASKEYNNLIVEVDSSSLIQLINDRTDPLWFLWNIIYCILNLLILFEKVRFALFEKRESIIRPIGYGTWLDKKGMNDFFFFFEGNVSRWIIWSTYLWR